MRCKVGVDGKGGRCGEGQGKEGEELTQLWDFVVVGVVHTMNN